MKTSPAEVLFYLALLLLLSLSVSAQQQAQLVAQVGHESSVNAIAFSRDGRLLLTGADDAAVLWEVATGREIRRFLGTPAQGSPFSTDARFVTTVYSAFTGFGKNFSSEWSNKRTEHLFDAMTGRELRFNAEGSQGNWAVVISPDNRVVATAEYHDNIVRLWDVNTRQELRRIPAFTKDLNGGIGFTRDGRFLIAMIAGRSKSRTELWDTATGQEVYNFPGQLLSESRNGRFLVTEADDVSHLWNRDTGKEIIDFKGLAATDAAGFIGNQPYWAAAFSSDSSLVALWPGARVNDGLTLHMYETIFSHWRWRQNQPGDVLVYETSSGREVGRFAGAYPRFSPDSGFLMTLSSATPNTTAAVGERPIEIANVWNLRTGHEVRRFPAETAGFSQDGRFVMTANTYGSSDKPIIPARLWDIATGEQVMEFEGNQNGVRIATFSPDNGFVATADDNEATIHLWDLKARQEVRSFGGRFRAGRFEVSPDERWVATTTLHSERKRGPDGALHFDEHTSAEVWDLNSGRVVQHFDLKYDLLRFSQDSRFIVILDEDHTSLREVPTWREVRRFKGVQPRFLPDGRHLSTSADGNMYIWEVETGREIWRLKAPKGQQESEGEGFDAFSPDSRYGLSTASAGIITLPPHLWDLKTGQLKEMPDVVEQPLSAIAFAPDGGSFLVSTGVYADGGGGGEVCLHSVPTGKLLQCYKGMEYSINGVALTKDNQRVLAGSRGNVVQVWDKTTGRPLSRFVGDQALLSPDEGRLLTSELNRAHLWKFAAGTELVSLDHSTAITGLGFMRSGRLALTASSDSALRLWDANSGKELCRLVTSGIGDWAVIAPDGRFDSNNLDEANGLHWVTSDAPFTTLPLEIFMRDYYEPQLLPRLIRCNEEKNCDREFKRVRDISKLNRAQPRVAISNVSLPDSEGYVRVTVEVGNGAGRYLVDGKEETRTTHAYDLRLFRDGQMVGSWPGDGAEKLLKGSALGSESKETLPGEKFTGEQRFASELRDWQQATEVKPDDEVKVDERTGMMILPSFRVKLPLGKDASQIELSAYVFNEDRIKSQAAKWEWPTGEMAKLPKAERVSPRAYVITMGVSAYENADFDLEFAADDARRMSQVVSEQLKAGAQYEQVVPVTLVSDYETKDCRKVTTTRNATKDNFRSVIGLLAGKEVDRRLLSGIENADQLQKATPDDLVLIMYSSHGYADRSGNFYFIPYDTGAGTGKVFTESVRQHSISSDELSLWLRDVDAGEMVMIVDACHSTAAVAGQDFKPGPMGSRGLGQLSYDKGMRILTATQSDNVAWEYPKLKQGVLTYALLRDGIEARQADRDRDNTVTLSEWLNYGVDRVPKLYHEVLTNSVQTFGIKLDAQPKLTLSAKECGRATGRKELQEVLVEQNKNAQATQQPSLFDFTRKKREVFIARYSSAR